jgi:threonine dehydrogenase-like Zn-dependent dehydrogenase
MGQSTTLSECLSPGMERQVMMMQALAFRFSLARFAFARLFGTLTPRAYLSFGGPTRLEQVPEPTLLGDDWTVVRTALCGVCGSDVKQVFLNGNFDNPLTALISFPQVLGHEAVGVVERVASGVKARQVGERVVLDPWLWCVPRGIEPPCDACQRGQYSLCEHFADGALPPGLHAGNCSAVTGGFAPLLPAHESQLIPIPDSMSFDQAVLADPFAVSLHAILLSPPAEGALTLVYGAGVLGLLSVAALRTLYPTAGVAVIARYPHQAELADQLGAEWVICTRDAAKIVEAVAEMVGARVYRPRRGLPWLLRGVDVIYDMVGSAESLEVGVRVANPRAPIVVAGVANPARFEWTPLYFKEVALLGSNAFGVEEYGGRRLHGIEHYLRLVEEGRLDLSALITHRFSLEQYQEAFLVMNSKARHGAVKAVFDFQMA